jgi:hypothetical protein
VSYLDPPRLHFAGRFQASISTVNNDPIHFDNATFKPEYQQLQTDTAMNGWFNPRGDADWRLIGCEVTNAVMPDGSQGTGDPVLDCLVADSDRLPPAKLVDLDPEQQLVSMIWGLEMRICDANGANLLRGTFEPAAFMDIWSRALGAGPDAGDIGAAAMFQSNLFDLEWGDVAQSKFLTALRDAAVDGLLSVKFNTDGINMSFGDPEFLRGRITGTIGAALRADPVHFVRGRQLMATSSGIPGFPVPAAGLNNCVASVDTQNSMVHLDLGNALPTTTPGGPIADIGPLSLGYISGSGGLVPLGAIAYTDASWYGASAGIVSVPVSTAQLNTIAAAQLTVIKQIPGGTAPAIAEAPNGLHCRADQFVFYLDPGQTVSAQVYASQFGQPYAKARIEVILDPYQLQGAPFDYAPSPGIPPQAVEFPDTIVADGNGFAALPITGHDPGNPRGYIDGQVYGIRPMLEETVAPGAVYPFNMWEFVSVLVFDAFVPDEPPTWWGSIQPIFQQYANLYPIMGDIVDLADYDSVCQMREMLLLAFELTVSNPNSMPVTRDLSTAKRNAILRWLRDVGPDGRPLLGIPPKPAPAAGDMGTAGSTPDPRAAQVALAPPGAEPAAPDEPGPAPDGGKAAAVRQRLAFKPKAGAP